MNPKRRTDRESGQVLVLFGVMLVALLGMGALAVDGGLLYAQRRGLQNAADAASLAATRYMAQSWTGGALSVSDSQVYAVASYFAGRNGVNSQNTVGSTRTITLEHIDQNGVVVGTHPGTVPGSTRGARVTVIGDQPAVLAGIFGFKTVHSTARAAARFGPPGSAVGVAPLVVDAALGSSTRLQPTNGNGNGNYVNAAVIDTSALGSHQSSAEAAKAGMRDVVKVNDVVPTSSADAQRFSQPLIGAMQDRIARGHARGDSATKFSADSPQLMIAGTNPGNFGGGTIAVTGFRGFFVEDIDPAGNWLQGQFVNAPLGNGSIDYNLAYTGVTITRMLR